MIHGFRSPYEFDMALLEPVWYMIQRGMRIDQKRMRQFHDEYHGKWENYQMKLNSLAGHEVNVSSFPQMKTLMYKELGLPPRYKNKKVTTNEDAIRDLMAYAEAKRQTMKTEQGQLKWLRAYMALMLVLKIRALRKRIESYIDVKFDEDGRMRTTLSVGGTETFRFSSSKTLWDTGCNRQTIPRELRGMYIADPGKELAELDLNRGESWIYSHLANEPEMMRIHREGEDFHTITACAISQAFGSKIRIEQWPELKKASPNEAYKLRYLGKKTNHATAYRMGPFKGAQEVNKEADDTGITVTKRQMKQAQELWLRKYSYMPNWWNGIEDELSNNARVMVTPYGRQRTFFDRWGDSMFKEATAYVPQSTSVDYINGGMLRVYEELVIPGKWGVELLHQNHDSIVIQYDEGRRDLVLPAVRELIHSTIDVNGHTISIPTEAKYGHSWGPESLIEYEE